MKPRLLILSLALAAFPAISQTNISNQWSKEQAWDWYKSQPWIVGINYVPSTAGNTTEWWQDETRVTDFLMDRELGWAEQLGYNSVRVFIQYIVYQNNPAYLKNRFERFLEIASRHGLKVVPVPFDDCFTSEEPHLGKQKDPIPGVIVPQWTTSPGRSAIVDPAKWPPLRSYLQDLIRTYGKDPRIHYWDLFNEPQDSLTLKLVAEVFRWAREIGPSQPLTVSEWRLPGMKFPYTLSDIISYHVYAPADIIQKSNQLYAQLGRPVIATEWLSRPMGARIEVDLPLFRRMGVGNYIWSFVNGRSQCQFPWGNQPGGVISPLGWWHDIIYSNGTPYRPWEIDAIRRNTALKTLPWAPGTQGELQNRSGCTDPRFEEFDSLATQDNGTCQTALAPLVIEGCLNSESPRFTPLATWHVSSLCEEPVGIAKLVPNYKRAPARLVIRGFRPLLQLGGTKASHLVDPRGRLLSNPLPAR